MNLNEYGRIRPQQGSFHRLLKIKSDGLFHLLNMFVDNKHTHTHTVDCMVVEVHRSNKILMCQVVNKLVWVQFPQAINQTINQAISNLFPCIWIGWYIIGSYVGICWYKVLQRSVLVSFRVFNNTKNIKSSIKKS